MTSARAILERSLTEAQWQETITDYLDLCRWRWYHVHDSRRDKAGFLDLWGVRERLVVIEVKKQDGIVSREQWEWLFALERAGVECHVYRPSDWPEVERVLR